MMVETCILIDVIMMMMMMMIFVVKHVNIDEKKE